MTMITKNGGNHVEFEPTPRGPRRLRPMARTLLPIGQLLLGGVIALGCGLAFALIFFAPGLAPLVLEALK